MSLRKWLGLKRRDQWNQDPLSQADALEQIARTRRGSKRRLDCANA